MKQNVFVVDHNADRANTLCGILIDSDMPACVVSIGQAIEALGSESEDIAAVFLSSELPPGLLTQFFREREASVDRSSVPVIAVANEINDKKLSALLEMGATDVYVTPLLPNIIKHRLKNLINLRESTALRRAVEHDPVTGICNREAFYRKTSLLIRSNPDISYTLVYMDVDHFKIINELFGADTGDRILREIANKLKERYHSTGTYSRLESDRFALCAPRESLNMENLLSDMAHLMETISINYTVNLYAGIYDIDDRSLPVDQMCDRAALALRTIKGNYFTRYASYDNHLRDTLLVEQQIVGEMNAALEEGQFCIYLQPLYSITTGEPISAEALVRWQHPTKGLISPGTFIPLFERNGFITKLDHYVWEIACQYLRDSQAEGLPPLPVSVNVSRMNLYNPRLCEEIVELTKKYGIEPSLLKLEITESAYNDNPRQLLSAMKKLHQYGFEILMDDFGSGYSSLNMLKDVPVDILKIDMRFLDDMESSGRAGNVMTSIIRMAKWLNMVVVAEGVETKAQIDFLRSIGCDKVQGFYYARPLPVPQFKALMLKPAPPKSREQEAFYLEDFDFDAIWESNKSFNLLFNGMIGGMGIYELSGDSLEVIRVNAAYYELMGATPQTLFSGGKDALSRVHPDDRIALLAACRRAMRSHMVEQIQIRRKDNAGRKMWLDVKIRFLGNAAKRELYYFALNDITRQKELERSQSLQLYGMAILAAYDEVRELNYTDGTIAQITRDKDTGEFQITRSELYSVVKDYANTRIHPDDREKFLLLHDAELLAEKRVLKSTEMTTVELRLTMPDGEYHWAIIRLYDLSDAVDTNIYLSCVRIIDKEKNAELIREENRVLQIKQREQERYQTIVEQTGTAVLEYSSSENGYYASELVKQYAFSELDAESLFSARLDPKTIAPPEDEELLRRFIASAQSGERSVSEVMRLKRLDGTQPWCRVHGVFDYMGGVMTRAIITVNDIDMQMLAELKLERQRENNLQQLNYLTRLYLAVPCGIVHFSMDDEPKLLYFNRACQEIFGFSSQEEFSKTVNKDTRLLMPELSEDEFHKSVERSLSTGQPSPFERRIIKADGSIGYISGVTNLERDIDDNPVVQSVFLDVTARREQERSLRETQAALERTTEELNTLLDNLPVGIGIFLVSKNPRIEYVNDRVYDILRIEPPEDGRIPQEVLKLLYRQPSDRELEALTDSQKRLIVNDLHHIKRADGSALWMRSYSTLVKGKEDERLCYAVLADVTQQIERDRDFIKQNELYRILMDESSAIFFDYDADNDSIVYSVPIDKDKRESRYIEKYLATLKKTRVIYTEHVDRLLSAFRGSLKRVSSGDIDFLADFYGKGFCWYRAYFRSIADEQGSVYRTIGRLEDINDEKRSEELLHQESIYKNAIAAVSMFVFRFDLENGAFTTIDRSDECEKRFFPLKDYLSPDTWDSYVHPDDIEKLRAALSPEELTKRYHRGVSASHTQCRLMDRAGRWVWMEITLHLMMDEAACKLAAIGYLKEIEDQKQLERRASFDEVTGVLNRAATEERIKLALMSSNSGCYLFICDVDDFKAVNDNYGHIEGDRLLKLISQTLKAHFRITDIVGRIGGDEFVALLYGVAGRPQAVNKAKEIMGAISSLREEAGLPEDISVSLGISVSPRDGVSFEELYRAADRALYRAKDAGKGQYAFSDDE